jgi:hypothetical protein
MTENPNTGTVENPKAITVGDAVRAPIIYFEAVSTFGHNNGIVNCMLAVGIALPTADGGTSGHAVSVAHLRCNIPAAVQLRDAIDKALLLAAPAAEGKAN